MSNKVFVFGSNHAGRHGKGSALEAMRYHGAVYGVGHGRTGSAYAIPTKDHNLKVIPLDAIHAYVLIFIQYAKDHPELIFNVVKIGCGLAGYREDQIAPFFKDSPDNVNLPEGWRELCGDS